MLNCKICSCKNFIPNIFDHNYCKECYHKVEKHSNDSSPNIIPKQNITNNSIAKNIKVNSDPLQRNIPPKKVIKFDSTPNKISPKSTPKIIPNKNNLTNNIQEEKKIDEKKEPLEQISKSHDINSLQKNIIEENNVQIQSVSLDLKNISKKEERKKKLITEIIDTESEYVRSIEIFLKTYLKELQDLIETNEFKIMFSNLIWIYNINSEFEIELKNFQKKNLPMLEMCSILKKYSELFKSYGRYSSGYEESVSCLLKLKKENNKFGEVLKNLEKNDNKKWSFETYLITPIQRICRYPLLLRELISCCEKEDESYSNLIETHKKIEEIVQTVNEIKRKREMGDIVNKLKERINVKNFSLIKPNRNLLFFFEEMVQTKLKNKNKLREIFIFNDIIVHLNKNSSSCNTNCVIFLQYCDLDFQENEQFSINVKNNLWKNPKHYMFKIFFKDQNIFHQIKSLLQKNLKKIKFQYEYISLGLIQLNNKNFLIKYCEISISNNEKNYLNASIINNKYIWIVLKNSQIEIISIPEKKVCNNFFVDEINKNEITDICNNSNFIFFSFDNGKICIFDKKKNKISPHNSSNFHSSKITCIQFIDKENIFVSCDMNGFIYLWKFHDLRFEEVNKIQVDKNISISFFFYSEKNIPCLFISTFDADNKISKLFCFSNIFDKQNSSLHNLDTIDGSINSICYSLQKFWVAIDKDIFIYSITSQFELQKISIIKNPHKRTKVISVNQVDSLVISFGQDSSAKIWNNQSYEMLRLLDQHNDQIIKSLVSEDNLFSITKSGEIYKWNFSA